MFPKLKLKTPPAETPVSVADLKNYLRIDVDDDDALIESMIKAATKRIEAWIDQKLVTQSWLIYFNSLPSRARMAEEWWDGVRETTLAEVQGQARFLRLPIGPIQSVVEFNTYADDNVKLTFSSTQYFVDTVGPQGAIGLLMGGVWPTTVLRPLNGVEIEVVAGFGTASQVPDDIREAVKITVAKLYENRGDFKDGETFTIPATAQVLLEPYRHYKVGGC